MPIDQITSDAHIKVLAQAAMRGLQLGCDNGTSYEIFDARIVTGSTAAVANTLYLERFRVPRAMAITKIGLGLATASGNTTVYLFTESGGTWTPLQSSAATAESGSNVEQQFTLAGTANLVPDMDYWGGFASTGAPTYNRIGNAAASALQFLGSKNISKGSYLSTGGPFTSPSATTAAYWLRLIE